MESLCELEAAIIVLIQSMGDWLAGSMQLFSMLGNEEFFLLLMPILYWGVNSVLGFRMAVMLLLSNGLNEVLKLALHTPRPYWVNTGVQAMSGETSFGAPSGHAQTATALWGLLAVSLGGTWTKVVLVVLIFLIGFSRLYLGVHFISDVLLGWLTGALLLWVFLKAEIRLVPWLRVRSLRGMLLLALTSSVGLALAILMMSAALGDWVVPPSWEQNALAAYPDKLINPLKVEGAFTISGTWFGLMAGIAWLYHRKGWFDVSGSPIQRVLRCLVGLVGVVTLWYGLGQVFPRNEDAISYGLRFLRYTLIGLWVSVLAPLLFERIKLSSGWQATSKAEPGLPERYSLRLN